MFNKMITLKASFKKAKPVEFTKGSAASEKAPSCGCLPMFGYKRLAKALSRNVKTVLTSQDKLEQHVEHLTQQTDGIALKIQVLPDGMVKCNITVVQLQPDSQQATNDVAATWHATYNCSEVEHLNNQPQAECAHQDELAMDVRCDVTLTDTVSLPEKAKGVGSYSSKLAAWCKKSLGSSRASGVTSGAVAQAKASSGWAGSSHNSWRGNLLGWGSAISSFRKSDSSSV